MLKLHAEYLVEVSATMKFLEFYEHVRDVSPEEWAKLTSEVLLPLESECRNLGFERIANRVKRLLETMEFDTADNSTVIKDLKKHIGLIYDLREDIIGELKARMFVAISEDKLKWYSEEDYALFGEEVAQAFPKSTYHIAEAGRCFALERWDACVHHLMLATEEALRKWGKKLTLKLDRPIVLANWEKILLAANGLLKTLQNQPKTIASDKKMQRLGEAIAHFSAIKEAWRNHCQHGREKYDERRARNILNHVEAFMRDLSSKNLK